MSIIILPSQLSSSAQVMGDYASVSKESLEKVFKSSDIVSLRGSHKPISSVKWNRKKWMLHLFGRILHPSHTESFEDWWILRVRVSLASPTVSRENAKAELTSDSSLTSGSMDSPKCNHDTSSSKTLKVSCPVKCQMELFASNTPSRDWKGWITKLRQEYSQRLKSARLIRESGCLSWRTPATQDPGVSIDRLDVKPGQRFYDKKTGRNAQYGLTQQVQVKNWPTPTSRDHKDGTSKSCQNVPVNALLGRAVHSGQHDREKNNTSGKSRELWATPQERDHRSGHEDRWADKNRSRNLNDQAAQKTTGRLNAAWVEQLLGLPVGWTQIDGYTGTENRVDRLRLCGNGVVPQCAARAWVTLWKKMK